MAKRQPPATDDLFDTKRQRNTTTTTTKVGILHLKSLDTPFISSTTNSPCYLFSLKSGRLYTIGRKHHLCNLVFDDPRVSKRHCQIFFDASHRKIFILDGFFLPFCSARTRFQSLHDIIPDGEEFKVRPSLNGVFVNGVRIRGNKFVELCVGDEVHFVCSNELDQSFKLKIGFVVQKVIFNEEVVKCPVVDTKISKACFKRGKELAKGKVFYTSLDDDDKSSRLVFLLSQCRKILHSQDPISYAQWCLNIKELLRIENGCPVIVDRSLSDTIEIPSSTSLPDDAQNTAGVEATSNAPKSNKVEVTRKIHLSSEGKAVLASAFIPNDTLQQNNYGGTSVQNAPGNPIEKIYESDSGQCSKKDLEILCSSPGKKFYLNRLDCKDGRLFDQHMVVSLPELLHPVESLSRMFIATFTSDIRWFLSYCKVSNYLPVTIACHNSERCWSSSPDKRILTPYEDFPNLMVVYPPFPEVIAFGQDRKRQGIACHHPKLLVLQREDSIRVVVTSANLVSKQWNDVTNTVWWQDFPLRALPDYSSLFTCANEETSEGFRSDFAAQLAGFMASLLVDVPSQAYWITELTKYEFGGAHGHLVASVPGMHRNRTPYPLESMYFLSGNNCASRLPGMKFLGSVEASLVGLKHRFHTAADSNGATLKTLAAFLRKCRVNAFGMSEVVLRRIHNIPADANAVSVLIFDLDEFSEGDYVQLGFLPRNIAKWVASLCDAGFFSFSAYIYPKEVLAAALEGTNNKVQLMLYVSQGPCFSEISSMLQPEHVASISSLVASLQRCVGLSRLQEVLGRYKWPELLETDFIYGSSSIGTSINSKFLAAFSSAAGKRSIQFSESEESDPEWGRWSATEELKKPSMRILYPTIGRVRDASCGIWPFRRLLCLSEGTWQRLKEAHIFHDAIPRPSCRVGYPMHVKVARRRFESKIDASSFGWVYCGSHNFSPAAWGRPTSSSGAKVGVAETNYFQGSRLHICNYELGVIFIVPPVDTSIDISQKRSSIDDIALPFVLPPPRYRPNDRPATAKAMREAIAEVAELGKYIYNEEEEVVEEMIDEIPNDDDDDEMAEVPEYVAEEREEEKAYAETLWSQVDSSEH